MSGRALPLIVVPQLAGSADLVRPFTHALPPALPVIVIEPPGFGASPSPRGVPSTRALASAVIAEWDRRAIGRAHLFGISLGGMVAQWIAIDAPDRLDHLVLASTAARGVRAVADAGLRALALARCLVAPDEEAAVCLVDRVLTDPARMDEGARASMHRAAKDHARSTSDLVWLALAAASHDADREAASIRAPTLVLSGEHDRLVTPETQALLAERIPSARQAAIPGAGHDITLEQPALAAKAVADFLGVTM